MNKVSIIIPVYNVERYLRECLDSIQAQTYPSIEVILVDDGSTDSSGKICDEYAANDQRFFVIHQKNAGAANAKNAGLDRATGEYITFVDSDDYVEKNWLERMMFELENEKADVVECCFDLVTKTHREKAVQCEQEKIVYTADAYMEQYLDQWTNSLFWLKVFQRKLTSDIRFRTERRCIDDEFYTYKIMSQANRIVRIEDVLYHYRQRKSSAVRSLKNQQQITKDALELRPERYLWIKKRHPNLRKKYLSRDIDYILYLAKEGTFDSESKRAFEQTRYFYIREALPFLLEKRMLVLCVLLAKSRPSDGGCLSEKAEENYSGYFE